MGVDKQGWAKKRRADWMATTGKIRFTRERVVPSQERELEPPKREESPENDEEMMRNIDIKQLMEGEKEPARELLEKPKMGTLEGKPKTEFWPRKKRSDITSQRFI